VCGTVAGVLDPRDMSDLFAHFSIETQPMCPESAVVRAELSLGFALPSDLRALLRRSNGLLDKAGQWYFVWPLERIVANSLALRDQTVSGFPVDLVAFGDSGTGDPFCIAMSREERVCRWSPIEAQVQMLADDLETFIVGWLTGRITT
jgi:hypothetical protein